MDIGIRRRRGALVLAGALTAPLLHAQHPYEELRVVGTPLGDAPSEVAQSISVLAGDTLRRSLGNTLGETLAGELGVSSTYFGAGSSRPVIRGLAGTRVKVMEDGIDALDVSSVSADHAVGIDPLAAQQIEIFRGPTTLLYGSGAVGGVVNTVTNRIPAGPPDGGRAASVELRADTVARQRSGAIKLDGGTEKLAWHVDGSRRTADDYKIPDEARGDDFDPDRNVVPNSDFDTQSIAAGGAWIGERGSIGVAISALDTAYGVPGHVHVHHHEPHDHHHGDHGDHGGQAGADDFHDHDHDDEHPHRVRVDLAQRRIDLRADWLGFERFPAIELRLGLNDYEHVELEDDAVGTRFRNDAYEARVEVLHAPWGAWRGAFGAQLGERKFSALGHEAFVPPVDTRTAGAFILEYRDIGAWQTSLGARIERVRHEATGAAGTYSASASSLSAAFVRRLASDLSFSVNTARSERAPAPEELYSNGPHLSARTFEVGSPSLSVETSRHLDVGVRRTDGRVLWALTAFRTSYDDFIYLAATGAEDEHSHLPIHVYAQRDARLAGIEAEVFAQVVDLGAGEIDVRLFADTVRARLDDGERVPRIPPRRVGLRVQYHDSRLLAGIEAVRYDDQRSVAPFESATEGYTLVGFDVAWTLRADSGRPLELLLKGTNLLDEAARKHTSIVKALAPLPGRNLSVGIRMAF